MRLCSTDVVTLVWLLRLCSADVVTLVWLLRLCSDDFLTLVWLLRLCSDDVGRDVGVAVEGLFDDQLYRRLAELQQGRVYARRRHDQYRRA